MEGNLYPVFGMLALLFSFVGLKRGRFLTYQYKVSKLEALLNSTVALSEKIQKRLENCINLHGNGKDLLFSNVTFQRQLALVEHSNRVIFRKQENASKRSKISRAAVTDMIEDLEAYSDNLRKTEKRLNELYPELRITA